MRFLFDLVLAIASGITLLMSPNHTLVFLAVFYISVFDLGYTWPRKLPTTSND